MDITCRHIKCINVNKIILVLFSHFQISCVVLRFYFSAVFSKRKLLAFRNNKKKNNSEISGNKKFPPSPIILGFTTKSTILQSCRGVSLKNGKEKGKIG